MPRKIDYLLKKEMSRREFFSYVGVLLISVFGIGTVLDIMSGHSTVESKRGNQFSYGGSSYGGIGRSNVDY